MKLDPHRAKTPADPQEPSAVNEDRAAQVAGKHQPLGPGLNTPESPRHSLRYMRGPTARDASPGHERVTALRSSRDLKRIAALPDAPARIGDSASVRALGGDDLKTSPPAALYLKDLTLNRSFNFFQRTNQIYVTAIAWDLSGKPPQVYPPAEIAGAAPQHVTFPMKPNETMKFIGEGIQLWPQRPVKGGLFVQLVVMESDSDIRRLGEKMTKVREAVENSELATALTTLGGVATGGKLIAIEKAALGLSRVVEVILKENDDDHVATFQGTYGAEGIKESRTESYDRRGASVTLNLSTDTGPSALASPSKPKS